MRVAASLRRFQSAFLMDDYPCFLALERSSLLSVVPDAVAGDRSRLAALEMVTSSAAWRRLRQDQGLPPAEAESVTRALVERIVDER